MVLYLSFPEPWLFQNGRRFQPSDSLRQTLGSESKFSSFREAGFENAAVNVLVSEASAEVEPSEAQPRHRRPRAQFQA